MFDEGKVKIPFNFERNAITAFFVPTIITYSIIYTIIFAILAGIVYFLIPSPTLLLLTTFTILLLILTISSYWYSSEFFKNFIFELRADSLFVKKGVITYGYAMIPYQNIQDIQITQSITDRLFGLCSISIFTATTSARGSETIFGLSKENAEKLKNLIFAEMKRVKKIVE